MGLGRGTTQWEAVCVFLVSSVENDSDSAKASNHRFVSYSTCPPDILLFCGSIPCAKRSNRHQAATNWVLARSAVAVCDITDLTHHWEQIFHQDLTALHCLPTTVYPRATDHIPAMLRLVQDLAACGLAYPTRDGSWYFDTQRQQQYGQQLVPQMNWRIWSNRKRRRMRTARSMGVSADFCCGATMKLVS